VLDELINGLESRRLRVIVVEGSYALGNGPRLCQTDGVVSIGFHVRCSLRKRDVTERDQGKGKGVSMGRHGLRSYGCEVLQRVVWP